MTHLRVCVQHGIRVLIVTHGVHVVYVLASHAKTSFGLTKASTRDFVLPCDSILLRFLSVFASKFGYLSKVGHFNFNL